MDKQGVGMEMWTSLQNAQLDHIPTPPTHTYPQGYASGLTRFACQTAVLKIQKAKLGIPISASAWTFEKCGSAKKTASLIMSSQRGEQCHQHGDQELSAQVIR